MTPRLVAEIDLPLTEKTIDFMKRRVKTGNLFFRSRLRFCLFLLAVDLFLGAGIARGQTTPPPQQPPDDFKDDTDPTQAVFLSVREEYYNLGGDNWRSLLILRKDVAFLKNRGWMGGKAGLLTRFEIPFATAHINGETHAGLGDMYGQFLYVPFFSRRFALAMGSGLAVPSATHRTLGSGKWTVAPLAVPVWFFPKRKGYFLIKLHQFTSFAGPHDRPDVNHLQVAPTLLYRVTKRSWILVDTESQTNWEPGGRTGYRSGVLVGHMFNRRIGFWVKPEIPWGPHRQGDWNLKCTMIMFR